MGRSAQEGENAATRDEYLRRLRDGFAHLGIELPEPLTFVEARELSFTRDQVTCSRSALFGLDDPRWDALLADDKGWVRTALESTADGIQVLSVDVPRDGSRFGPGRSRASTSRAATRWTWS